jgi:site-specific recombinase XerD
MLGDYAVHGAVLRRYNRSVSKLNAAGAETVARFQEHLRSAGRSASTVRTYGTLAGEFVAFTGTRGGLACCDANMIGAFVATLAGYQFKTVEQKLCAVRSFLRFASADGLVDGACLEAVPAARSELLRVFRTGNLRLIHAAACPFRNSSMTSCGVRYPSPEWRRVLL